jgi:hypothetical protein
MAVNALGNFLPVLRPQIPEHKVWSLCCRKIGEPVDSAVLASPVSGVHMVRMHLFGEPRPDGLFGREKALLRLGYFEESSSGFFIRARNWKPLEWHGFYSLRRGIATQLTAITRDPMAAKGLLRHSSVNTALAHYIKEVPEVTANGMAQVEQLFTKLDLAGQAVQ